MMVAYYLEAALAAVLRAVYAETLDCHEAYPCAVCSHALHHGWYYANEGTMWVIHGNVGTHTHEKRSARSS